MLHPSRTRSPEASMGHLPGNPAEEPESARSGGHLPGKSPWADAGSASPPPWQALGALSGRAHEGFSAGLRAGDAVRASGGPILAFAERSGCGQDSVLPTAPAADTNASSSQRPQRGAASREPSASQRAAASRERPASQRVATSRERLLRHLPQSRPGS